MKTLRDTERNLTASRRNLTDAKPENYMENTYSNLQN